MIERDYERLHKELSIARCKVMPGLYEHYASGGIYVFERLQFDKATEEMRVSYHDERAPHISWSVPLDEWTEEIEYQGEMVPRYRWLAGQLGRQAIDGY